MTEIQPGYVAVAVTVIMAFLGAGMYVIRSEVMKGNQTATASHDELTVNHGSSIRDAVDRIEKRQIEDRITFLGHVAELHAGQAAIRTRIDQHIDNHHKGA